MQLRKSVWALAASCCRTMRHWSLQNSSARSNRSFLAASTWASAAHPGVTPQPLGRSAVLFMLQATISRNLWTSCAAISANHNLRSACMRIPGKARTFRYGSSDRVTSVPVSPEHSPFAFAAHFQPGSLLPALQIYRSSFRPSQGLDRPYAMVGVPILVADSDEQAQFLATTPIQMFLNLIRGVPGPLPPPTKTLDWTEEEREMVTAKFGAAIFGGPEHVAARLNTFLEETQADELMVVANTYKFEDRLRSYELLSNLAKQVREEPLIAKTVEV